MNELLSAKPVIRFGRTRTQHDFRVLIEPPTGRAADQQVVVRTCCGLMVSGIEDAQQVQGFVTCEECGKC